MGLRGTVNSRLSRTVARMRRDARSGSAAIEFAVIAPVLFLFLFGIIETGVLFFAGASLQNAVDNTARLVRTGQLSGAVTATTLKSNICNDVSPLIATSDCNANLQIDLRTYSSFNTASYPSLTKSDGSLDTNSMAVQATSTCQVVLMRAFYPWSIMTPLMSTLLANMPNGQRLLTAADAFRTEPYTSGSSC